jgi:predicted SAM-dependent methyltransferase
MPGGRKLDIGAGPEGTKFKGFESCDIRPGCDYVCNATHISSLGKFVHLRCYMVLEHLKRYEYPLALKDWYNALEDGGILELTVPDMDDIVSLYSKNPEEALWRMYGSPKEPGADEDCVEQLHKWGFNEKSISKALKEAGFSVVERVPWTAGILFMRAIK